MDEILEKICDILRPIKDMDDKIGIIHLPNNESEALEFLEWLENNKRNKCMPKRDLILEKALIISGVNL